MSQLITPEALAADPAAIVFDCRFSLADSNEGRRQYQAGHIPGARYADLEHDLSGPAGIGGRHPLPDSSALTECLRSWGVSRDSDLVCYDQNSGALACRFWWLVRWLGHARVRVLDGGLDAWLAAGFPADVERVAASRGDFEPGPSLTRSCSADDLVDSAVALLDARDEARFRGDEEPLDPIAGHIPGARCVPFTGNLEQGHFKPAAQLAARFRSLGLATSDDIVCYCGSGVTATHNVLALLEAGFGEPMLYPGSWSEWITDPARPVARGS